MKLHITVLASNASSGVIYRLIRSRLHLHTSCWRRQSDHNDSITLIAFSVRFVAKEGGQFEASKCSLGMNDFIRDVENG